MNQTQQVVLQILKELLNDQAASVNTEEQDWTEIYKEMKSQSLLPLTYFWVQQHGIPNEEIANQWKQQQFFHFCRWHMMMKNQTELLQLLAERGYAVAILKGSSNGVNYPKPQYRVSGDIDFLVRMKDYEEIYTYLLENGYTLIGEKDDLKHHVELKKNNITFEMHKRPGGTRLSDDQNEKDLIDFFQAGLDHVETVTVDRYTLPILSELETAMILLLHTSQHMKGGLGLRHILDWMMFAKDNVNDDFWNKQLKPMAQKGHVENLAKVMTKMCQKYLGLTLELTWCKDADDYLCDQLMEYVFQQGDFGIKTKEAESELRLLSDSQSTGFFTRMANSSLYSMPIAKKYVILRPIAWIYQLIRYVIQFIHREHPIRTYLVNNRKAKKRTAFLTELGVRRDEK